MRREPVAVVVALLALIAVAAWGTVAGSTGPRATPPIATTAPVTSATLVCPEINGVAAETSSAAAVADIAIALTPPSQSTGTVTETKLKLGKSTTKKLTLAPSFVVRSDENVTDTVALHATGSVAASLVASQGTLTSTGRYRGLAGTRCVAPSTDWWFAGADGRVGFTDILALANPAPTAAEVSISLWGTKGPVTTSHLESVRIPAKSVIRTRIASIAPDIATIALHVHATSGAVTAALLDRRSTALRADGGDFLPATAPPARSGVIAGFASGAGGRRLIIADPGSLAATVSLRLITRSGSFTPAGDNQVVVRAGHTRVVSLDRAFGGVTGAVGLSSDQPVVAQGLSVASAAPHRPDLMWLAATPPLVGSAGVALGRAPDGGHTLLLLSAPLGASSVRVRTPTGKSSTIPVPAGHSVAVDITATIRPSAAQNLAGPWPFVVTALGSAPVYGVRVLTFAGAHGALITDEPLVALPAPIVLPAVRQDPGVATH